MKTDIEIDLDELGRQIIEEQTNAQKYFSKPCIVVYDDENNIILKTDANTGLFVDTKANSQEFDTEKELNEFINKNKLK